MGGTHEWTLGLAGLGFGCAASARWASCCGLRPLWGPEPRPAAHRVENPIEQLASRATGASDRPAQASLFSADAHTLGFYGTFEGRVHFGIIPQPRRNNLLEESRDKLRLVRVLSTFAGYRSSGYKLTLSELVCTARIGGP